MSSAENFIKDIHDFVKNFMRTFIYFNFKTKKFLDKITENKDLFIESNVFLPLSIFLSLSLKITFQNFTDYFQSTTQFGRNDGLLGLLDHHDSFGIITLLASTNKILNLTLSRPEIG